MYLKPQKPVFLSSGLLWLGMEYLIERRWMPKRSDRLYPEVLCSEIQDAATFERRQRIGMKQHIRAEHVSRLCPSLLVDNDLDL